VFRGLRSSLRNRFSLPFKCTDTPSFKEKSSAAAALPRQVRWSAAMRDLADGRTSTVYLAPPVLQCGADSNFALQLGCRGFDKALMEQGNLFIARVTNIGEIQALLGIQRSRTRLHGPRGQPEACVIARNWDYRRIRRIAVVSRRDRWNFIFRRELGKFHSGSVPQAIARTCSRLYEQEMILTMAREVLSCCSATTSGLSHSKES